MPTFAANGSSFNAFYQGFSTGALTAGQYYAHNQFGASPSAGAPIYEESQVAFTGVDGVATIRKGFRGRPIFATLVWAGSEAQCNSGRDASLETFRALARYTISLPNGGAFDGCKLASEGACGWANIDGLSVCFLPLVFMQLSDSN